MKKKLPLARLFITILVFSFFASVAQNKVNSVNPVSKKAKSVVYYSAKSKLPQPVASANKKAINSLSSNHKVAYAPLSLVTSFTNETCGAKGDGTASVSVSGGTPPYKYYWDGGNATGSTTSAITGLYSGVYTVVVADSACSYDTAVVNIGLDNSVYLGFGASSTAENCGKCNGDITVFPSGGAGNTYYYSWSPGGYTTGTISNLCSGYYVLTLTDSASGCSETFDSLYYGPGLSEYPVTVSSIDPNLGISYYQSCDDSLYFFSEYFFPDFLGAEDTSCYKPLNWQWFFGDGGTAAVENPVHSYTLNGAYTVTLVVNNTDTATLAINYAANSTVDFDAYPFCDMLAVDFYDMSTICANTWLWNFGDPGSGTLNTDTTNFTTHYYPAPGTYTVSLIVNSTDTIIKTITIDSAKADFSFTQDCSTPVTYSFYDNSVCAASWYWNFGDPTSGTNDTSTTVYPSHTYTASGTYTVTLIVGDHGIYDTIQKIINTPPPALTISLGNDTLISQGSSVTLDGGPGGKSYYWSNGDTTRQITVTTTGFYNVLVQDSADCYYSSTTRLVVVCSPVGTSIAENKNSIQASVFPNPFSGNTTLSITHYTGKSTLIITDVLGHEIKHETIYGTTQNIQINNAAPGLYFYRIILEIGQQLEGRLIIQ